MLSRADKTDGSGKVEGIGVDANFLIEKIIICRDNLKFIMRDSNQVRYEAIYHEINPSTLEHSFDDGVSWYSEMYIDLCIKSHEQKIKDRLEFLEEYGDDALLDFDEYVQRRRNKK